MNLRIVKHDEIYTMIVLSLSILLVFFVCFVSNDCSVHRVCILYTCSSLPQLAVLTQLAHGAMIGFSSLLADPVVSFVDIVDVFGSGIDIHVPTRRVSREQSEPILRL